MAVDFQEPLRWFNTVKWFEDVKYEGRIAVPGHGLQYLISVGGFGATRDKPSKSRSFIIVDVDGRSMPLSDGRPAKAHVANVPPPEKWITLYLDRTSGGGYEAHTGGTYDTHAEVRDMVCPGGVIAKVVNGEIVEIVAHGTDKGDLSHEELVKVGNAVRKPKSCLPEVSPEELSYLVEVLGQKAFHYDLYARLKKHLEEIDHGT